MGTNAEVLRRSDLMGFPTREAGLPRLGVSPVGNAWDPAAFAHEQIRGLVQRVFLTNGTQTPKQVVFSAADEGTDVASICDQVGRALAQETRADIAIVSRGPQSREMVQDYPREVESGAIKSWSAQIGTNLWRVSGFGLREGSEKPGMGHYWLSCLAGLRIEFDFAVIHGPAAGISARPWCWRSSRTESSLC